MTPPQPPLTEAEIGAVRDVCGSEEVEVIITTTEEGDVRAVAICDAIDQLRRERDEAREALKPFADAADSLGEDHDDGADIFVWESPAAMNITAGDLRRARKATST